MHFYGVVRADEFRPRAVEALRTALRHDPFAPDLHRNLAGFLVETGDMAGAERHLGIVRALSPRSEIVLVIGRRGDGALRHR